jgi:CDP-diacylglycerol--serine O-phosphatidyltransferase
LPRLRSVAVIPSLFTLGNGICGFVSIIVASRIHPDVLASPEGAAYVPAMFLLAIAGWLILAGMVFDALDGRVARIANTATRFGTELDSLCDVVTFGAAPAFLMLKLGPTADNPVLYKVLFISATFYVVCTALRLARFNVETALHEESHRFFKGLPSPAAAGCIAAVGIMRYDLTTFESVLNLALIDEIVSVVLPFGAIILSVLMVSNVKYPHVVNQNLRGKHSFGHLVQLLVCAIVVLIIRELSLMVAFWGFAAAGPIRLAWRQSRRPGRAHREEPAHQ